MRSLGQFIFFTIKFHKHKKEFKALKSTTNLRFINLKFINIRFIDLKFMDIRFIKPKKHLSEKSNLLAYLLKKSLQWKY